MRHADTANIEGVRRSAPLEACLEQREGSHKKMIEVVLLWCVAVVVGADLSIHGVQDQQPQGEAGASAAAVYEPARRRLSLPHLHL